MSASACNHRFSTIRLSLFPPAFSLPLSPRIRSAPTVFPTLTTFVYPSTTPSIPSMRFFVAFLALVGVVSATVSSLETRASAKVFRSCTKPNQVALTFDDG